MDEIDLTGPYTRKAAFPIHWTGMTKPTENGGNAFVCGACPDPDACLEDRCTRAGQEDWDRNDSLFRALIV